MKLVKKTFILFFFFLSLANNSWSQSPSEFISVLTIEASNVLSSKLTDEEKIIKLKKIGERSVDIHGVGLYTLGKHRKTLTETQKNNTRNFLEVIF